MAGFTQVAIAPGTTIDGVISIASQSLSNQGYEVRSQILGPSTAEIFVTKDRDGIKNIVGMGVECHSTITLVAPGQLSVTTDSVWTNKIIALAVGWFLCWIPIITGIIGCIGQSDLPKKITTALSLAGANSFGTPGFAPQNTPYAPQAPATPYAPQAPVTPQAPGQTQPYAAEPPVAPLAPQAPVAPQAPQTPPMAPPPPPTTDYNNF